MRDGVALGLVGTVFGATLLDPFHWMYWSSYDQPELVAWEIVVATVDVVILAVLCLAVVRGWTRAAARLGAAQCVYAFVFGTTVTHLDLFLYARLDVREYGWALLFYIVILLLRSLLAGYLFLQHSVAAIGLPLTPDDDGRFAT